LYKKDRDLNGFFGVLSYYKILRMANIIEFQNNLRRKIKNKEERDSVGNSIEKY
jgi:hypothetical protein